MTGLFLVLLFVIYIPLVNANSMDPDQTLPRIVESDLGLHCLYLSPFKDAMYKWIIYHFI